MKFLHFWFSTLDKVGIYIALVILHSDTTGIAFTLINTLVEWLTALYTGVGSITLQTVKMNSPSHMIMTPGEPGRGSESHQHHMSSLSGRMFVPYPFL